MNGVRSRRPDPGTARACDVQALQRRLAVEEHGRSDGRPLVLVHGFGCDSEVWRFLLPHLSDTYRLITLDLVGAGRSELAAYDPVRYDSLDGYAADLVALCEAMELEDAVLVGHSVSAMTVVLAARRLGARVTGLVLIAPSPRYLDDEAEDYTGGFTRQDVDLLLDAIDANWVEWAQDAAPVIMGPAGPGLEQELVRTFCRVEPRVAQQFAEVTFLSDHRRHLREVDVPTLVLQCSQDALAPAAVGEYVAAAMPRASLHLLGATGHCPHMSAPGETATAVRAFLER